MFDSLISLVRGYRTIDLQYEFDRRSQAIEGAEEPSILDRDILRLLNSRLHSGQNQITIKRGESLYSVLKNG
jgi:hypothetical protein